jgi:hypothetical protein
MIESRKETWQEKREKRVTMYLAQQKYDFELHGHTGTRTNKGASDSQHIIILHSLCNRFRIGEGTGHAT